MHRQYHSAKIEPGPHGSIAFFSSYDPGLVAALKAEIPTQHRRWDPEQKCWLVSPQYAQVCADLALQYLGVIIDVPNVIMNHTSKTQLLKLEYLGAAKDRGDGQMSSFGWCNGDWSVIMPLKVLRMWFEPDQDDRTAESATLYGILGIAQKSKTADIKSAYRRAARTWHPDISKEPDSKEQFQRIQHAWEILSDQVKRAKYDAGLRLTATLKHDKLPRGHKQVAHWKPPLRCGYILAEGTEQLGRFVISRILKWADIVDNRGTLVTYWPTDAKHFEKRYV
jgi:hypothetical protein